MSLDFKVGKWIPDLPDFRDKIYKAPSSILQQLPSSVDLRDGCPPVYQQGQLGSCTANAISGNIEFLLKKQNKQEVFTPSRLFIYFNERDMEGTVMSDAGAMIRDGIKSVNSLGVCKEDPTWPYRIERFADRPTEQAYDEAKLYEVLQYQRINNMSLRQMKGCLAEGYPFVFGFAVYDSFFETKSDGTVRMPDTNEQLQGGHAVLAVGYDDNKETFIVRNSWGPEWADKGYCYMPYEYLNNINLTDDCWSLRLIE